MPPKRKFTKDSNNTFHIELEDMIGGEDLHDMDEIIDNQRDGQRATVKLLELYNEGKVTELQFITVIQKFGLFGIHAQNRRDIAQRRGCTVQNIDALYKKAVSVVRDKMEQEDLENHDYCNNRRYNTMGNFSIKAELDKIKEAVGKIQAVKNVANINLDELEAKIETIVEAKIREVVDKIIIARIEQLEQQLIDKIKEDIDLTKVKDTIVNKTGKKKAE